MIKMLTTVAVQFGTQKQVCGILGGLAGTLFVFPFLRQLWGVVYFGVQGGQRWWEFQSV